MGKIELVRHLTTEELAAAARGCDDADLRARFDAIRLVSMGWPLTQVAAALGRLRGWVRDQVKRFNLAGVDGLTDRRHHNRGAAAKLSEADVAALREALRHPSSDGGLWNGRKVRVWIAARLNADVGKRIGWRYLRRLGFTIQRPQTRHAKANVEQQEDFKKNSGRSWTTSSGLSPKPRKRSEVGLSAAVRRVSCAA